MSNPELQPPQNPAPRIPAFVVPFLMGFAFLLMLAGPVLGFNVGGVAGKIGLDDGDAQCIIGIASFVMGATDLLVVYWLFLRKKTP